MALSFVMLAIGAVLVVAVHAPGAGVNLQTLGMVLMLLGMTALNVVMTLREPPGHERSHRRGSQT